MTLEELDKEYILQTYKKNYVNFKEGVNSTLYDDKNKDYIDFTSGIGVVSVGHGNKKVANTICKQIKKITHTSNSYMIEPQVKLAKKISLLSGIKGSIFFANSGAEANECAIKIARKYGETKFNNKKYKVITLKHSFHGRTITTVKATGQKNMHKSYFTPYPDGFKYATNINNIYKEIDKETVAVMIELVQGEGGVQPFKKRKIQKLARFLKKKEILLIVDEVQTGIFRTGEFLASNLYQITPDIITMAKGLGGGVPIGAVLTSHKDILTYGDHGSTFGGNYLSTSASLNVCSILEDLKNNGKLKKTILHFETKLNKLYTNNLSVFTSSVGIGLMRGLRVKNIHTLDTIINKGFEAGVLVLKAGKNTLRFLPPLTISKKEINEGFKRLEMTLKTI
ncbi:Acetylornithine aminotransferase [hydrothermal vent metagenome]|uniref:Acetylornithine aminotransferase n=1 Tax=hydrothermal vent metagenome TaxID=652676 RepID=A0A3B1DXE6_9ZZZZ